MPNERRIPLEGSERIPLPGARRVGAADPDERLEVTLVLRPRASAEELAARAPLDRDELAAARGADPADIETVRAFAGEHDLRIRHVDEAGRRMVLEGTVAALSAAFAVDLGRWEHESGAYRGRVGPVNVPESLARAVVAVLGLDDRPQARTQFRRLAAEGTPGERSPADYGAIRAATTRLSYTPVRLAEIYDFPPGDGTGQTIAIIELGGGYLPSDLQTYFGRLGLPVPAVEAVGVDGGSNAPAGSPDSADGEVALDIEVAGAIAPGARIAVYFAPNTDRGFLDAISAAVHDTNRKPSIISISWGGPESAWTGQAQQAFDQAFQDAQLAGVSVFAAAGDRGSDDGVGDGLAHVDFPASSPHVTACGGTSLVADAGSGTGSGGGTTGSGDGAAPVETVWNDGSSGGATGGGVSATFPVPSWQGAAGVPPSANAGARAGRGVPDVAGDADPATGYQVLVDGTDSVFGGTSAVAPLWAGLTARLNQSLGAPLGFLNPRLYGLPASGTPDAAFNDVTQGSNGAYSAAPGWDACTGFGSPHGQALLAALSAPSGTGQSGQG